MPLMAKDKDLREALHTRLQTVAAERYGSAEKWARAAGISPSTLTRFLKDPDTASLPSIRTLDKLEGALGEPLNFSKYTQATGTGSKNGITESGTTSKPLQLFVHNEFMPLDIEVLGTAAGSLGEGAFQLDQGVINYVKRLPGIMGAKDIYGIYIIGESMEPRFFEGELVYVSARRPVRINDYVIVQVQGGANDAVQAYCKRLLKRSPQWLTLEQHNPQATMKIATKMVLSTHRILTTNELAGV